jgi:uncharacterized protein YbjT (DUF2867 family)
MKFLVTGGTGFIGACVVQNLLARGIPVVIGEAKPDESVAARLNGAALEPMDVSDERAVRRCFKSIRTSRIASISRI